MIRTDIYRIMGDAMSIDSTSLGMDYMTETQMKNDWGTQYEVNYNLVTDCVAATSGRMINYNGALIEARYTQISSGTTLSGAEVLGDTYAYLAKVSCPDDMQSPDYLSVCTISYKEFVKKMKAQYSDIGLEESNPFKAIQVVSKSADGYVLKLQVGNVVMSGEKFAEILGINSACMTIENLDNSIKITTKGKGNDFGVSIYTADIMAGQGSSYEEILKKFYTGIILSSE
jgi:stage II sporulation protein D